MGVERIEMAGLKNNMGAKGRYRVVNLDFVVAAVVLILLEAVLLFNFMIMPFARRAGEVSDALKTYTERQEKMEANLVNASGQEMLLTELKQEISELEKGLPPLILNEDISLSIGGYAQKHNIALEAVMFSGRVAVDPAGYMSAAGASSDYSGGELGGTDYSGVGQGGTDYSGVARSGTDYSGVELGGTEYGVVDIAGKFNGGAGVGAGSTAGVGSAGEAGSTAGVSAAKNLVIQGVQVNFSSEFHTAGAFIKELENSVQKVRIRNVSLTRVKEGALRGVINMEYIALTDNAEAGMSNRFLAPAIEGKESPFQRYKGYVEDDADPTVMLQQGDIDVEPNFYMVINSSVENDTKVRFGVYPLPETEIYFNVNNAVRAKLTISGDDQELSYTYTIGQASRTERRRHEITDGRLLLNVISRPRANEDDKVSVLLDVENNTGMPLEIKVRNDDVMAPRFVLGETIGDVTAS